MNLVIQSATRTHLRQMMSWFSTAHDCLVWGGVSFRFPFTSDTFAQDCAIDQLPSYVLLSPSGELHGFGQCSLRCGRIHLGRLAIAPACRNQGMGTRLLRMLAAQGTRQQPAAECSLFVALSNPRARALYERLGFRCVPYPDKSFDASAYDYMIIPALALGRDIVGE